MDTDLDDRLVPLLKASNQSGKVMARFGTQKVLRKEKNISKKIIFSCLVSLWKI